MATILTFPKRPERQDTDAALDAGPAHVGHPLTRKGQSSAPWAPLVESMARHRRDELEVGWLKENAELLGILNSTGHSRCDGGEAALAHLRPFVETAPRRLQFFPQYYRFILSICLDYEDLTGGATDTGSQLAHWIATRGLVCGELSDLQRAEAQHLLARRAVLLPDPGGQHAGLRSRLRRFASDTAGFAIPDRRRAYELTHVVFYLTDYGRRCAALPDTATQSLIHVGLWAYLDCDWDLVAEVCIALRYLGQPPPPLWEAALQRSLGAYRLLATPVVGADDYHAFFVGHWWRAVAARGRAGQGAFADLTGWRGGALTVRASQATGLLAPLSLWLLQGGSARVDDAIAHITTTMGQTAAAHLAETIHSSDHFARFWHHFCRQGEATAKAHVITARGQKHLHDERPRRSMQKGHPKGSP